MKCEVTHVVLICIIVVLVFKMWYEKTPRLADILDDGTSLDLKLSPETEDEVLRILPQENLSCPDHGLKFQEWQNRYGPETWKKPELPEHLQNRHQSDPELVEHIREEWIIPPSPGRLKLDPHFHEKRPNRLEIEDFSEYGQPTIIKNIINGRTSGVFIESGAADGQRNSNTLYLELFYNWTGVLIEPNPKYFYELQRKNRHCHIVNACLSPKESPVMANFSLAGVSGGIHEFLAPKLLERSKELRKKKIQCLPLYSILLALNIDHVDYFSLDIEGAELDVLRAFPFDHVTVDTISIEKQIPGDHEAGSEKKLQEVISLLSPLGYKVRDTLQLDVILSRV